MCFIWAKAFIPCRQPHWPVEGATSVPCSRLQPTTTSTICTLQAEVTSFHTLMALLCGMLLRCSATNKMLVLAGFYGQLGHGDFTSSDIFQIQGLASSIESKSNCPDGVTPAVVACGRDHSACITRRGQVSCLLGMVAGLMVSQDLWVPNVGEHFRSCSVKAEAKGLATSHAQTC